MSDTWTGTPSPTWPPFWPAVEGQARYRDASQLALAPGFSGNRNRPTRSDPKHCGKERGRGREAVGLENSGGGRNHTIIIGAGSATVLLRGGRNRPTRSEPNHCGREGGRGERSGGCGRIQQSEKNHTIIIGAGSVSRCFSVCGSHGASEGGNRPTRSEPQHCGRGEKRWMWEDSEGRESYRHHRGRLGTAVLLNLR